MSFDDADLEADRANFAMTEWEQGAREDGIVAERAYPCGCKEVRVHTAAGWQWVDAPSGDCGQVRHPR